MAQGSGLAVTAWARGLGTSRFGGMEAALLLLR